MSGILGILDPSGTEPGSVAEAARIGSEARGEALTFRCGPWILATQEVNTGGSDVSPRGVVVESGVATVADAWIHGSLAGRSIAEQSAAAVLSDVLAKGPAGLASIAGDYAVARYDDPSGVLTMSRDAIGLRPLFWARGPGGKVGFASDVETLIALGLVDGSVDHAAVRTVLFEQGEYGQETCYAGVRRVMAGRWVKILPDGRAEGGRWFRPEAVAPEANLSLEEAGKMARDAILSAITDRARGRRIALSLSAGRDSSTVAVALAEAGIRATCFTYSFHLPGVPSEAPAAERLATDLGHEWFDVHVEPTVPRDRAMELADLVGGPVPGVGGPIMLALHDAARGTGCDTVLSGEGGDLLFSAFPIGILDLVRAGRLRAALTAARGFRDRWTYGFAFSAKVVLRGIAPRPLLEARERRRESPPWLIKPSDLRMRVDRTDRTYLRNLLISGGEPAASPERVYRRAGVELTWPLCDLRVIQVALQLPVERRLPVPAPKPVLQEAFLGERAYGLVKASLAGYFEALVPNFRACFPEAYGAGSLADRQGLVRASGLGAVVEPRWTWQAADLAGLDMWLRWVEERYGA